MEPNTSSTYEKEYMPSIIRWGRVINLLMIPAMFFPCLVILLAYGISPNMSAAISGGLAFVSFNLPYYFTGLLSCGPILHVPGTYLGMVAGNTKNIMAVAVSATLDVTGVKTGTHAATVVSAIAVAAAVFMKFVLVLIIAVAGGWLLTVLPQQVITCLGFLLPALIGAMWMQWMMADPKMGGILLAAALIIRFIERAGGFKFLPGGGSYMAVILCVALGFITAKLLYGRKPKTSEESGQK